MLAKHLGGSCWRMTGLMRGFARSGHKPGPAPLPEGVRTAPLKFQEYSQVAQQNNYNLEEHKKFTKKIEAAKEQRNIIEAIKEKEIIPRRSRRVYDQPRNDLDISEYEVFRNFADPMMKVGPLSYKVVCKIEAPPALVEKAFGQGFNSNRNGKYATKEWDFTDSNLDQFLVYDYKATTRYWGPNLDPLSDSFQLIQFYVNATDHAEFRKFKIWFLKRIEAAKVDTQSYEEKVVAKYGPIQDFADHGGKYTVDTDYAVFKYSRKDFNDAKWTPKDKFDFPLKASSKLDDSHLIEN